MAGASQPSSHHQQSCGAAQLRVLIADDDSDAAVSLAALVKDAGHSTHCVHRGREVLGAAHGFRAEVVLLDIGMPGIDGYDIARILRKVYGNKLCLIAVTAWSRAQDKLMAKTAGFDHHFGKPYDPEELLGVLKQIAATKAT